MKKIVICGAGEVGSYAAELLSEQGHRVAVVDLSEDKLKKLEEFVDISSIHGSSCAPEKLLAAGVSECDLLVAATNQDEINMLTSILAKTLGARKVIARIHQRSYVENRVLDFRKALPIDHIICPERITSIRIAEKLTNPGVAAIERFAGSKILMHTYCMDATSRLLGSKLHELDLPEGTRIAVIQRDGDFRQPTAQTQLIAGDQVVVIGIAERFDAVERLFSRKVSEKGTIAITGSGSIVEWLATALSKHQFSIKVFETDPEKARELAGRHTGITVINADPTDSDEFLSESLQRTVAFIAATDSGEHNILAALQAKQQGCKTSMAILHEKTYLELVRNLGIDFPFSPRSVATSEILKLIDDRPIRKLASLAEGIADVYALNRVTGGKFTNLPLCDIKLPPGSLIAGLERSGQVIVPGAQDRVLPGDSLLAIGPNKMEKILTKGFRS